MRKKQKKDKVLIVMVDKYGRELGRFRAYLAWSDGDRGRLFDGREVVRDNDKWIYVAL